MTWIVWLALIGALPVPYFMVETGRVPAAQLMILAAVTTPLAFSDPSLTTRFVAGFLAAQSLFYGALLYLAARALARRIAPHRRAVATLAAVAALVALSLFNIYRAPLSHGAAPTNIVGVFW